MRAPVLSALLLVAALAGCAHAPPLVTGVDPESPLTVFADIAVFPGTGIGRAVPHQDVWVHGERVEWVGLTGQKVVPSSATVVAGSGLTLLPGLIDGHVHVQGGASPPWDLRLPDLERNLESFLFAGITSAVDLGGDPEEVAQLRDDLAEHRRLGPHLLIAGPVFTAPGGHPVALIKSVVPWPLQHFALRGLAAQVGTPSEADSVLDTLLHMKPDVIKLACDEMPVGAPTLDLAVAKEIVQRAHRAGLKAVAHVGSNADMTEMMDAGIDVFVHDAYREKLSDAVAERIARAGIPVEPTLAVFDEIDRLSFNDLTYSALTRQIADPRILKSLQERPGSFTVSPAFRSWLDETHANRQVKFENVRTLRRHGVTILAGSDSPNVGHFPGAALHTELSDLVQSGMSPSEVLYAATGANALVFGLTDRGVVAPGRRADLLVVRGDPTLDIASLDAIQDVYLDGRRLRRQP